MIYRIKIVEDGKFVRYATDEEMSLLKPKADGNGVEQFTRGFENETCSLPSNIDIIYSNWDEHFFWQDVSDTHKVEWGCIHEGKELYANDIVTAEYYLFQDEGKYNYHGLVYYDKESHGMGLEYVCVASDKRGISDGICNMLYEYECLILLGNLNENPELLPQVKE